jgi:hypothetical protein
VNSNDPVRENLVRETLRIVEATAAQYQARGGFPPRYLTQHVLLKLDKPLKWWHVGKKRRFIGSSGVRVGDIGSSVIMDDGTLVKAHWGLITSSYTKNSIRCVEYYYHVGPNLEAYSDDELQSIINKLTPLLDEP